MSENVIPDSIPNALPEPFQLSGPQEVLRERLYRLIGPGAADFYVDACRHMDQEPPFITTTHLVGHALREVESAVRAVLKSIVPKEELLKKDKEDRHIREVRLILNALGFQETDQLAKLWLELPQGENGLQKKAHRNNLGAARPLDDDFRKFWFDMDSLLYALLDKFESHYINFSKVIDDLAQSENPTETDAQSFNQNIPHNFISWKRFFDQLKNPAWLPLLVKEEIFKVLPNEDDQLKRRVSWAAADYLKEMAKVNPGTVTEILQEVSTTNSPDVKRQLLEIVNELDIESIITLFEKIKEWAISEGSFLQLILTDPIEKIIGKLADGKKEKEAFELASLILTLSPDPNFLAGAKSSPYRSFKPSSLIGDWHYNDFLEKIIGPLFGVNPEKTFKLLTDLLQRYREFQHPKEDAKRWRYNDNSYYSRMAVEEHAENRGREDIEDALIDKIRDTGLLILKENPQLLNKLVKDLLKKKWKIFHRIALHFVSKMPASDKKLTTEFLVNPALMDNAQVQHEFADLMRSGFKHLKSKDKKLILDFIKKAEPAERLAKKRGIKDSVNVEKYKDWWRRDQLSYIVDVLPKKWEDYYKKVTRDYGQPDHPDFPFYSETGWVEPQSDFSAQQLAEMSGKVIIETLKNWQPDPDQDTRFSERSRSAFGREIVEAVKLEPEKFQGLSKDFEQLDPTYVRSYLEGFSKLMDTPGAIDWTKMLDLCHWVASVPRHIEGRKGGIGSQDPDWGWTKRAAVSFIKDAIGSNSIPFELREKVWENLELFTEDRDPKSEDEQERGALDAYSTAINSTRGEALSAVIGYGLWVYRQLGIKEAENNMCFDQIMPEVKIILERHLDPSVDPSLAIRAVYGKYFPWLYLMDEEWVKQNIEKIFPEGQFKEVRYRAAWDTLMLYVPVFDKPFEVLKEKYIEAMNYIGQVSAIEDEFRHRDEKTADSLIYYYGRGKLNLTELKPLWEKADDSLREHVLDTVGRNLKSAKVQIPPEVIERYKKLWETRVSEVKKAKDKSRYQNEMSAFGWWFASGAFDQKWSFQQYLFALGVSKKDPSDHTVLEHLEKIASSFPEESVLVLEKLLLEREEPNWIIIGDRDQIEKIFKIILATKNQKAIDKSRALLGRVMSKGYTELNNLTPLFS